MSNVAPAARLWLLAVIGAIALPLHAAEATDGAGSISCVATHVFACGPNECSQELEASNGSVRLYLDLRDGTGQLCEYTQCRTIAAAWFGETEARTAQVVLGPSSTVLHRAAGGEAVGDEELQPTLGATVGLDAGATTFVFSQVAGSTVSGYSGTCEREAAE
jgi:hypothetical protein